MNVEKNFKKLHPYTICLHYLAHSRSILPPQNRQLFLKSLEILVRGLSDRYRVFAIRQHSPEVLNASSSPEGKRRSYGSGFSQKSLLGSNFFCALDINLLAPTGYSSRQIQKYPETQRPQQCGQVTRQLVSTRQKSSYCQTQYATMPSSVVPTS